MTVGLWGPRRSTSGPVRPLGHELSPALALHAQGAEVAAAQHFAEPVDLRGGAGFEPDEAARLGAVPAALADLAQDSFRHVGGGEFAGVARADAEHQLGLV